MEFVYANMDGLVLNRVTGGHVMLHRNDIWFADDPFVELHRGKFSATPLVVHSTVGRLAPPATALLPVAAPPAPPTAAPVVEAKRARARA